MEIVLVIWSMDKTQALQVLSSNLPFISHCWDFIFSSQWMPSPEDGRYGKPALLSPALLSLRSGRMLSW